MHCSVQCNKYSKTLKQFIILDWIKLLWNRLSLWAGLCKCSWNKIIVIQWRQLANMSDLTVLSACWDPISKAAHKYVRPHSVISLLRPDIEGSSQICQTSLCHQPVETRYRRQLTDRSDLSQCYQPVETRYRRQLIDMSDLTVLSACWDPISKAAHKYVRPHSVISLLRPDIEGSSQICQTSQCHQPVETRYRRRLTGVSDLSQWYQPVETRYRRQLTNMSDLTVLSACWDSISKAAHICVRPLTVVSACWNPISKAAHRYVRPHSVISLLRPDIEGSSQICQTSHSVISLLRPDIEDSSQICQTSQCYQPVEARYRRQLTNMSDLTVLSACWDPISKAAHKYVKPLTMLSACWDPILKAAHRYVIPHSVIVLLRPDIEGSSQICQTS